MAVPPFQRFMLPMLRLSADGRDHTVGEMVDSLADQLSLNTTDLSETLRSGQSRYQNRVYWARVYLGKALLLESAGRGRFRITARGRQLLKSNPPEIDLEMLRQYPEFHTFQKRQESDQPTQTPQSQAIVDTTTPEEAIELGYKTHRNELSDSLLKRVMAAKPSFFEQLVVELLLSMGYGGSREDAGRAVGRSGDGGIDGTIKEDRLGLDIVYIQAKRWEGTVGSPAVHAFVGALTGKGASKGVLITTSQFSKDAQEFVKRIPQKVVLIDGEELVRLMIDFDVGVVQLAKYELKKINLDYFEVE